MRVSRLYPIVAKELGMTESRVRLIYQSYWKFLKDRMSEIPFREGMTQEDFIGLKSGFHMQNIGKFYCNYKTYSKYWRCVNHHRKLKQDSEKN